MKEIEGMTEIRSGRTEGETGSGGGRELTSVREEQRGREGRTEGTKTRNDRKVKKVGVRTKGRKA